MDEVLPDLFISGIHYTKPFYLEAHQIKTVLTLFEKPLPHEPKMKGIVDYQHVKIYDCSVEDMSPHFPKISKVIADGLKKGRVLVHCQAGMSRSSSAIICFIIDTFNVDYYTALKSVKINHPLAHPNTGFHDQLVEWEAEVKGRWVPTKKYRYFKRRIVEEWKAGDRNFQYFAKILRIVLIQIV